MNRSIKYSKFLIITIIIATYVHELMNSRSSNVAVCFRTHVWDDFIARAAQRIHNASGKADFYILANETAGVLPDTGYPKIAHTERDFERIGLICEPKNYPVLWWNCDYALYDLFRKLPDYDYYMMVEFDAYTNVDLYGVAETMSRQKIDWVSFKPKVPVTPTWPHAHSCSGLPYSRLTWTPVPVLFISRAAIAYLYDERLRLAKKFQTGQIGDWAICEAFISSALCDARFSGQNLGAYGNIEWFDENNVIPEYDPRMDYPLVFLHSVLDRSRVAAKFLSRTLPSCLDEGMYDMLEHTRNRLLAIGLTDTPEFSIRTAPDNLARGKPATQSSTAHPKPVHLEARRANKGIISPQCYFHTKRQYRPWWSVDLLDVYNLEKVVLFNTHFRPERAMRLSILVSEDGRHWRRAARKTDAQIFSTSAPYIFRLPAKTVGRFVKVVLDGWNCLHLSEVEVYGTPSTDVSGARPSLLRRLLHGRWLPRRAGLKEAS